MTERAILPDASLHEGSDVVNGVVGLILAVPILRYLLSPFLANENQVRFLDSSCNLEQFLLARLRLVTYRNPVETPGMDTANIACWVRNVDGNVQVLR